MMMMTTRSSISVKPRARSWRAAGRDCGPGRGRDRFRYARRREDAGGRRPIDPRSGRRHPSPGGECRIPCTFRAPRPFAAWRGLARYRGCGARNFGGAPVERGRRGRDGNFHVGARSGRTGAGRRLRISLTRCASRGVRLHSAASDRGCSDFVGCSGGKWRKAATGRYRSPTLRERMGSGGLSGLQNQHGARPRAPGGFDPHTFPPPGCRSRAAHALTPAPRR